MRRQDLIDPYIEGSFSYRGKGQCEVHGCNQSAFGVRIQNVVLPFPVEHTILKGYAPTHKKGHIYFVGLTCGCYAKFHRQVAHIITNMNIRHCNEPGWEKIPTP